MKVLIELTKIFLTTSNKILATQSIQVKFQVLRVIVKTIFKNDKVHIKVQFAVITFKKLSQAWLARL